jgi:hypothetical protein
MFVLAEVRAVVKMKSVGPWSIIRSKFVHQGTKIIVPFVIDVAEKRKTTEWRNLV